MGQVFAAGDNAGMAPFFALLQKERSEPAPLEQPPGAPDRDHHLDRTHRSTPTTPDPPRSLDPRVRDNDEQTPDPRGLTQPVAYRCSSPVHLARKGCASLLVAL